MGTFLAIIKAIITRLVFAAHGFIAIWQVTLFKKNNFFWYLSSPILLLVFEGIFTLTIKENQEWKWFCPSVFLYLLSVIPSIWLLELEKIDKRVKAKEDNFNLTATAKHNLKDLNDLIGVEIKLPEISLSTETWITVIEQFLMLILIIGRWMLPKGELTRDQLSQLLLVYIGTAADIIEFFDSFKDDKVASHPILVLLTLSIWSWSLLQFTVVLTATKSRKSRLTTASSISTNNYCCGIDVCGIVINITLQDAPFLVFRLLLITHFNIISYMNIFFTCKNTLVIVLQLYRLHVVYGENRKNKKKRNENVELSNISIISKGDVYRSRHNNRKREISKQSHHEDRSRKRNATESEKSDEDDYYSENETKIHQAKKKTYRKDTGYSTGSSLGSTRKGIGQKPKKNGRLASKCRCSGDDDGNNEENQTKRSQRREKQKLVRSDKHTHGYRKQETTLSGESQSDQCSDNKARRNAVSSKKKVVNNKQQSRALSSTTDISSE